MKRLRSQKKAAAALSTILIVGAIVVETALAALVASYLIGQQGLGLKRAQEASLAARSGIQDALIHLLRDKDFNPSSNPYTIAVNSAAVSVLVCKELAVDFASDGCSAETLSGRYQIGSTARVSDKRSRFRATLIVATSTGLIRVESIEEVAAN